MRRNRKRGQLLLFYIFLLLVTLPWNSVKYLLKGQTDELKAFLQAIRWNFTEGKKMHNASPTPLTFTAVP